MSDTRPVLFDWHNSTLASHLQSALGLASGVFESRDFPDGETYLRILSEVKDRDCVIVADICKPNDKFLPLMFLVQTLKELGAGNIGLVAPYLAYMRQDKRFHSGEAITSKIFAAELSAAFDWLITVDPHLHRYNSLDEVYSIPSVVVEGAPVLAEWLGEQQNLLLVGPDEESEQWVQRIATLSGHPYVIGNKQRLGDRHVIVELPDISSYAGSEAVILDDVISSGQTILQCIKALQQAGIGKISCGAVHGIFAEQADQRLLQAGLQQLMCCNTISHARNQLDISGVLLDPLQRFLNKT